MNSIIKQGNARMVGKKYVIWVCFMALVALSGMAQEGSVSGHVTLKNSKGKPEKIKAGEVVVFIRNYQAPISEQMLKKNYVITTRKKQFSPQLMVVPKGASIQFPNMDPIIHNVFSVSGKNRFDAGRYGKGEGKHNTFDHSGLVRIYCNVHHDMNALVMVTENEFFSQVDEQGRYSLKGLPPGEYDLVALHLRAGQKKVKVSILADQNQSLDLEMNLRRVRAKRHLNKHGKPYKRSRKRY